MDSFLLPFALAAAAACCGELVTAPIDFLKTRAQLQGELGSAARYSNIFAAIPRIVREEGVLAFYRALSPGLLRQASYGSIRMGLFDSARALVSGESASSPAQAGSRSPLWQLGLAGASVGACAAALTNPLDVVKVRMQVDYKARGEGLRYRGVLHALQETYSHEGFRGLWAGLAPNVQRAAVVAATELGGYEATKQYLVQEQGMGSSAVATHLLASTCAGFICSLCASPLDVLKSRIMAQPFDSSGIGLRYAGMLDCFSKSLRTEGPGALWKGFFADFARRGPHTVVQFVVLERLRAITGEWREEAGVGGGEAV